MRTTFLVTILAAIVGGGTAAAHHSYAGYARETLDIEGVLDAFERVNPHAFLKVRGTDGVLYLGEWVALRRLLQDGVHEDTLKVGDRLVITGLPRLDIKESGLITIRGLRRPVDGWSWAPNLGVRTVSRGAQQGN
jgi:hypothetical protein